ncbi:MAG: hypothetical protein FWF28_01880 [Micrococcales bacterium]|nr:hypothetical protein [Micrococcales bacterium]
MTTDETPGRSQAPVPDSAGDDSDLRGARSAAHQGDWRTAAWLLAGTADPDLRWERAYVLAEATQDSRGWLDAWLAAAPDSRDARGVQALAAVVGAWALRGSGWAVDHPEEFRRAVPEAAAACREASRLAPDDVVPLVGLLILARVEPAPRAEVDRRFAAVRALAPWHLGAHEQVLQYLCAKWHGSTDQMFAFARGAAGAAPEGSPLNLLVAIAQIEHILALARSDQAEFERYRLSDPVRAELWAAGRRWTTNQSAYARAWGHNVMAGATYLTDQNDLLAYHLAQMGSVLLHWPWEMISGRGAAAAYEKALGWSRSHPPAARQTAAQGRPGSTGP